MSESKGDLFVENVDFEIHQDYYEYIHDKINRYIHTDSYVKHFYGLSNKITGSGKSYLHEKIVESFEGEIPILKAKNLCDLKKNIKTPLKDPEFLSKVEKEIKEKVYPPDSFLFLGDEIKSPEIFDLIEGRDPMKIVTGYQPEQDLGKHSKYFEVMNIDPDLKNSEIESYLNEKMKNPEKYKGIIKATSEVAENFGEAEIVTEKLAGLSDEELENRNIYSLAEDLQKKISSSEYWEKRDRKRNFSIDMIDK